MVPEVRRCPSPSTASTPCCSVSSSLGSPRPLPQRLTRLRAARLAAALLVLFMLNAIREILANI